MDNKPEIPIFVKAMTSAERLRIVGLLCQGAKHAKEIADALGVHPSDVMMHLEQLSASGVVHEAEEVYELGDESIESLVRDQLGNIPPDIELEDANVRKVLKNQFKKDGTLRRIPSMGNKLAIILNFIVNAFSYEVNYTEKEINMVLRRFHLDTAALRRLLVDHGLMARDGYGNKYWREKRTTE